MDSFSEGCLDQEFERLGPIEKSKQAWNQLVERWGHDPDLFERAVEAFFEYCAWRATTQEQGKVLSDVYTRLKMRKALHRRGMLSGPVAARWP